MKSLVENQLIQLKLWVGISQNTLVWKIVDLNKYSKNVFYKDSKKSITFYIRKLSNYHLCFFYVF